MDATVSFRIGSNNPMSEGRKFTGRQCSGKICAHVTADIVGRHLIQDRPETAGVATTIKVTNDWRSDSSEVCLIKGSSGFLTPTNLLKLAEVLGEVANELKAIEEHTHKYE